MAGKPKAGLVLSNAEHAQLRAWVRNRKTAQSLALRARIVLECAGADNRTVAALLSVTPLTVSKWRNRFIRLRLAGLHDASRSGAPPRIAPASIDAVIIRALEERPANATHWSSRALAREMKMSQSAVSRIWRAFGIDPSRHEPFRLSADPRFVDKVQDIAGLYLNPPIRALALCAVRKPPRQTASPSPTGPDSAHAQRHAALSQLAELDGRLAGERRPGKERRRAAFLKFLRVLHANLPTQAELHLVLHLQDTELTEAEQLWLLRRSRDCHVHYAPSPASWLNQLKRWHIRLATTWAENLRPTRQLEAAVREYLARPDATNSEPFHWSKSRDDLKIALSRHVVANL